MGSNLNGDDRGLNKGVVRIDLCSVYRGRLIEGYFLYFLDSGFFVGIISFYGMFRMVD